MEYSKRVNELLTDIIEDRGVPRNIKVSIEESLQVLEGTESEAEKVASILSILDEASSDPNLSLHARTKIWNMMSFLESISSLEE